jgi:hypothetical protein
VKVRESVYVWVLGGYVQEVRGGACVCVSVSACCG